MTGSNRLIDLCFYPGPANVFTLQENYRQTILRVSVDGEETAQSADLMVEMNRTLPIVVEGVRVSYYSNHDRATLTIVINRYRVPM